MRSYDISSSKFSPALLDKKKKLFAAQQHLATSEDSHLGE